MMRLYSTLKVRTKILLGFGFVVIIMLLLVAYALVGLRSVIGSYENLLSGHYLRRDTRYEYRHAFEAMQRYTYAMLVYAGVGDIKNVELSAILANDALNDTIASLDEYDGLVAADNDILDEEKSLRWLTSRHVREILYEYNDNIILAVKQYALEGDAASGLQALQDGQQISDNLAEVNAFLNNISDVWFAGIDEGNSSAEAQTYAIIVIALAATVLLSIGITIMTASSINKSITFPAQAMAGFLTQIQETGSLNFPDSQWKKAENMATGKDDISQALAAFLSMIKRLSYYGKCLEEISNSNLSGEINTVSSEDTLGSALVNMQDTLNCVFENLTSVSHQVAMGAKQLAGGSQGLAQGSTQQAASVQQLSGSISEIAQKTKENAKKAERAATLASTIKSNAEKGNHQMNEMISAVREINQAGQSISKVIKVIDDIAFQTNILALNAAVEAARAGQHGKGFAVVAEEVRNLAAKSAEAAKDTGGLISNSIEKAELGSRIAGDTAASLTEIVSGINESSQIVSEIAKSSEEQSIGISQINSSIDQVAEVTHQNSATAQESAAASQEMNGQSSLLDELISQFKLKNSQEPPLTISQRTSF